MKSPYLIRAHKRSLVDRRFALPLRFFFSQPSSAGKLAWLGRDALFLMVGVDTSARREGHDLKVQIVQMKELEQSKDLGRWVHWVVQPAGSADSWPLHAPEGARQKNSNLARVVDEKSRTMPSEIQTFKFGGGGPNKAPALPRNLGRHVPRAACRVTCVVLIAAVGSTATRSVAQHTAKSIRRVLSARGGSG